MVSVYGRKVLSAYVLLTGDGHNVLRHGEMTCFIATSTSDTEEAAGRADVLGTVELSLVAVAGCKKE